MRVRRRALALAAGVLLCGVVVPATPGAAARSGHEVWAIDQSDSVPDGGGRLYVYDGAELAGNVASSAAPEVVDLGSDARAACLAATATAPRRPHMLLFSPSQSHAIVSFVATGHVLFLDAASRRAVGCVDVGAQAHAAVPTPDGSSVLVANQNGKLLQRIRTDFSTNTFTLDSAATITLATCTTPSGAACQDPVLRPDNAPICPIIDATGRFAFVTLRGGGLLVVDPAATPMRIVAEYDRATVHPNGCGGVEAGGKMYVNSGGGTAANPVESDLYAFSMTAFSVAANPPNMPAPAVVFSHDGRGFVDSHGATPTKRGRYLWLTDRAANRIVVVDTSRDTVVDELDMVGDLSRDPAPDLLDVSPNGNRIYVSLRGPNPLTANVAGVDNAVGATPGVGVLRVEKGGARGVLQAIAPISNAGAGTELADVHGLRVRQSAHGASRRP